VEGRQETSTSGGESGFPTTSSSGEGRSGEQTNKMISTNIDSDSTVLNLSNGNRQHYTNSDLCLIENNNNSLLPREISENQNNLDSNLQSYTVNLVIDNIIIISCSFAILIGSLYIINKIYKLLTKPKLVYLDN
jgi:hypothetical protein